MVRLMLVSVLLLGGSALVGRSLVARDGNDASNAAAAEVGGETVSEPAVAEVPEDDEPAVAEMPGDGQLVETPARPTVLVVVGAAGTAEYGALFAAWAERWRVAAEAGRARCVVLSGGSAESPEAALSEAATRDASRRPSQRDILHDALQAEPRDSLHELWIVLIGHGTFDGRSARFNLVGPDVSADELAAWLADFERPLAVVNCASASGPFVATLARPGRVVVAATKSGQEQQFARFGDFLSSSIAGVEADLDHDGQTSLFEAWLHASRRTTESYVSAGRLPTEHAVLEDTGDGQAARADLFASPTARPDDVRRPAEGRRAAQFALVRSSADAGLSFETRRRRDALELEIAALRDHKDALPPAEYYERLEQLLVTLARLTAGEEAADATR